MSNYIIPIPDIGEGITEVELVEWLVEQGEHIHEDQNIASVMTEKVSVEITTPVSGVVRVLGGQAGDILAVGAPLVEIEVDAKASPASAAQSKHSLPDSAPQDTATESAPKAPATEPAVAVAPVTTPHQRLLDKVQAPPAVRKRAADLGIELGQLAQQLQKNHLNHADLDQYLAGATSQTRAATLSQIDYVPVRGVRRQIAQKMQSTMQQVPHFSYVEAVDVTALEAWRQQLNDQWEDQRGRLSMLPFIVRAIGLALKIHPALNARFNEQTQQLEQYQAVHMAIATHTDQGLMVPVLTQANERGLWDIASTIHELAQAARQGQATLTTPSTITLTSLGALGGIMATPIINAPEVAIVGINKQVATPVVIEGKIEIRTLMNISSSFDHRFIDGMHAAQFIQTVRTFLESPTVYLID